MSDEINCTVPEFLRILWKLVNDPVMNELIHWNEGGDSFTIVSSLDSWKVILKLHYKHSNMSSFIRQLNLYGFKRMHLDKDCVLDDSNFMCFYHPYFKQNEVHLLQNIKRKNPPKVPNTNNCSIELLEELLRKIDTLSTESSSISDLLQKMKNENVAIWRELTMLRRSCDKQSEIISSLFHFLLSFVRPTNSDHYFRSKRKLQLMIEDKKERGKRFRRQRKATSVRSPEVNVMSPNNVDSKHLNFNADQNHNEIVDEHKEMGISPKIEIIQNDHSMENDINKFILHEDVMLTPKDNGMEIDNFLQPGTSSSTNMPMSFNENKNELSLFLKGPNSNNAPQENEINLLADLLKDKRCNMDPTSFLDMFNYTSNLPLDNDFLSHFSNDDNYDYEKCVIPYSDAIDDEITEILNSN